MEPNPSDPPPPPRARRGVERALVLAVYLLPIALIARAITFWGRGIIDSEGAAFILNYLADRPLLSLIFDPRANDWGAYQARELSYLVDLIDARVFAAVLHSGVLVFIPLSGVLGLMAFAAVYLLGSRKVLRLDGLTASLLLSLFLSCIVVQASTAIFYRSSKILLAVAAMAFFFQICFLLEERAARPRPSRGALAATLFLGLSMALCDRQGFYYLVATTGALSVWWVSGSATSDHVAAHRRRVIVTLLGAIAAATLYNNVIAPRLILRTNKYWPDFAYQQLPVSLASPPWGILGKAFAMFRAQVSYLAGNLPFVVVVLMAVIGYLAASWEWRAAADRGLARGRLAIPEDHGNSAVPAVILLLIALVTGGSLVVLLAMMILRHPPVFDIPDHSMWYYTLTIQVVLLFLGTLYVAALTRRAQRTTHAIRLVLLLMIASNLGLQAAQKKAMLESSHLSRQYAQTKGTIAEFEMARTRPGGVGVPSWVRAGPRGVIMELPFPRPHFLDRVEEATRTRRRLPSPVEPGPLHWGSLRDFLAGPGSPLDDLDQTAATIEALRSIGVGQVALYPDRYADPALGRATMAAFQTATGQVVNASEAGGALIFDLMALPLEPADTRRPRPIDRESFVATASHADGLPLAFDGNPDTRWSSDSHQSGTEWIRLALDRPRDVGGIRMDLARSVSDYPRGLVIESAITGDDFKPLYEGSVLGPLMKGLLRDDASLEISLPPNHTKALRIRQTGRTRVWFWSIHELTLWER
jgi:hypothetical protein